MYCLATYIVFISDIMKDHTLDFSVATHRFLVPTKREGLSHLSLRIDLSHSLGECRQPAYHLWNPGKLTTLLTSGLRCCNAANYYRHWGRASGGKQRKSQGVLQDWAHPHAREITLSLPSAVAHGKNPLTQYMAVRGHGTNIVNKYIHFSIDGSKNISSTDVLI